MRATDKLISMLVYDRASCVSFLREHEKYWHICRLSVSCKKTTFPCLLLFLTTSYIYSGVTRTQFCYLVSDSETW